jgi:BirA family biotin operon repressor/biotin-[acetyl-CoA-carboxylase] ligase
MEIQYYHFTSIDSTQTFAKSLVSSLPAETLAVVSAEKQTQGRGRYGKSWSSPAGKNITMSLVFKPEQGITPFQIAQFFSLLLQKFLSECGIEAFLKWPNDLLVDGKKIAGILVETHEECVIVGIGLNVAMNEEECEQIDQPTTSMMLEKESSVPLDILTMQQALMEYIQSHINELCIQNISALQFRWQEALQWMIGKTRMIEHQEKQALGTITAILPNGTLFVRIKDVTVELSSATIF